jgi:hypothetical protein
VTQAAASICSRNIRDKLQPSKAAGAESRRASAPIPSGLYEAQLRLKSLWICGRGARIARVGGPLGALERLVSARQAAPVAER